MSSSDQSSMTDLRIYGDNILECERALFLIASSFSASVHPIPSAPYLPQYKIQHDGSLLCKVDLLPGYGQWSVNPQEVLKTHGAPLREAADAVITRVISGGKQEEIILALEFCNALPAGNNAWQRNGRALSCAVIGVPFLYYAEVGGMELDRDRVVKAPRFPNPIVPFSYLTATKIFNTVCLPIYSPSPSSSEEIRNQFEETFGFEEGLLLIRRILENASIDAPYEMLIQKGLTLTQILSAQRRRIDTLRGQQWIEFFNMETSEQKASWLEQDQNRMRWSKKRSAKVRSTATFERLFALFRQTGMSQVCISIGADDIPLCLVPGRERRNLAEDLLVLYGESSKEFVEWIDSSNLPLIVAWIYGFKPRGEDSRPDRGLVPMARMLFGGEIDILSIVYGPARPTMWETFQDSPEQLAIQNGLWETVINLGDAVLVDSATAESGPMFLLLQREHRFSRESIRSQSASSETLYSEHHVDSTLHLLFAHQEDLRVFEGMCNPPGGDWSGLSVLNFELDFGQWTISHQAGEEQQAP